MTGATVDRGRVAWLVFGLAALVGGTMLGWNTALLDAITSPPPLIRAALVGASVAVGLALVARAIRRIDESRRVPTGDLESRDLAGLIRGVRYVFLAVAAFAAAGGWLLAHPLPLIVALVIAGVDVLETTFLLLVVSFRREA